MRNINRYIICVFLLHLAGGFIGCDPVGACLMGTDPGSETEIKIKNESSFDVAVCFKPNTGYWGPDYELFESYRDYTDLSVRVQAGREGAAVLLAFGALDARDPNQEVDAVIIKHYCGGGIIKEIGNTRRDMFQCVSSEKGYYGETAAFLFIITDDLLE